MMVNLKSILNQTREKKFAVGSFNVYNFETIKGVIESAKESQIPAIVSFGEKYLENMEIETVQAIVRSMAEQTEVPIALHLDHCKTPDIIFKAIKAGFTSVMYDGSALPYEQNLKKSKAITDIAHAMDVSVEAELGSIAAGVETNEGSDEDQEVYTNPVQADEFVKFTGIDALAVSIGTVHGMYKGEPKINIEVLKEIASMVNIPLVLHGGSGTPEAKIRECIENGICKINVNTEISVFTVGKIRQLLAERSSYHLSTISLKEVEYVKEVVKKYMKMFYGIHN